ncbi:mCG144557, partial [Mus musculus]
KTIIEEHSQRARLTAGFSAFTWHSSQCLETEPFLFQARISSGLQLEASYSAHTLRCVNDLEIQCRERKRFFLTVTILDPESILGEYQVRVFSSTRGQLNFHIIWCLRVSRTWCCGTTGF